MDGHEFEGMLARRRDGPGLGLVLVGLAVTTAGAALALLAASGGLGLPLLLGGLLLLGVLAVRAATLL